MPLLQSLEDDRVKKLKSLKYPSGQAPYVQKDINNPPIYNSLSTPITRRIDDVVRFTKMLTDTPGIKFLANQALLSQTDTLGAILRGERKGIDKEALRGTANVLKTVFKQVPVNGTGTHFYQTPAGGRYIYTEFGEEGKYTGVDAASLALYAGIIPVPKDQLSNFVETKNRGSQRQGEAELYKLSKESSFRPTLSNDPRPSSKDRTDSLGPVDSPSDNQNFIQGYVPDVADINYDESNYKKSNPLIDARGANDKLKDPQTRVAKTSTLIDPNMGDVLENQTNQSHFITQGLVEQGQTPTGEKRAITIQRRKKPDQYYDKELSLGNQAASYETDGNGNFKLDADGNKIIKPGQTDYVNLVDFNYDPNNDELGDLIDFRFSVNGTLLAFRAHLTAFNDNHTGNWSAHQYIGRADQFYTYQGYSRGVTIGFTVAATSQNELQPLYRKLNYLASANAPRYSGNNFMQGTVARVTVGDYLKRTPGVINSVGLSWQTDYPWDINLEGDSKQLPMVLNATVNLNIIHDFTPQVNTTSASTNSPFFAKEYVTDPTY